MYIVMMKLLAPVTGIKKMDLLVSVYIFCILASEIFGSKTIPLLKLPFFTLNASVAIFLFPLVFTINDIIVEVYGKERARSIIRSSFVIVFMLFLFSLIATALPPSARFVPSEEAYDSIFSKSARFAAASLIALIIADLLDVLIFTRIRQKLGESKLWLRNNVSNMTAQFFDTALFMTLAFYAFDSGFLDNATFLISLIIPYWLLKCAMSVIETPLVYLGVKWLRDGGEDLNNNSKK